MEKIILPLLQGLSAHGHDIKPPTDESPEQATERRRKSCEFMCECQNKEVGALNEQDGYNCDKCHNKGVIFYPLQNGEFYEVAQKSCDCMKSRRTIRAMLRSGLKDVVHKYTFDNYIVTEQWQQNALDTAKNYLANGAGKWFYYGGQSGAGKSHLCTAIAIQLLKRGQEVKYMLWQSEVKRLKPLINEFNYKDAIKEYIDIDVLYIDDLFKARRTQGLALQNITDGDFNLAFEIINERYNRGKTTIVSCEYTIDELMRTDDALTGRILEKCDEFCFNVPHDSKKNYRFRGSNGI